MSQTILNLSNAYSHLKNISAYQPLSLQSSQPNSSTYQYIYANKILTIDGVVDLNDDYFLDNLFLS